MAMLGGDSADYVTTAGYNDVRGSFQHPREHSSCHVRNRRQNSARKPLSRLALF